MTPFIPLDIPLRGFAPRLRSVNVEMVQEELDRQAAELRRVARGFDAALGPESRAELQVSRILHLSDEQLYEDWPKDMPTGWLDDRIKTQVRVSAHTRGLLFLAEAFDQVLGANLEGDIDQLLAKAREATPTAMAAHFYEVPLLYPPDEIERDLTNFVFEAHDQALRRLEDALGELESKKTTDT